MAGNGPPPAERRRRNNPDTYADVQVSVDGSDTQVRGPKMPSGRWLRATMEWYDTWRSAPQAATFLDTDWQRLAMLTPLVDAYFRKPHHLQLAEIRLNESLLGATHVDRLKGRMKVDRPATSTAAATPAGVAAMDDYRKRIAG